MNAITPDTVLAEISSLAEAKEIARDMRMTCVSIETKYGARSVEAKLFDDRYNAFVDAMAEKFAA